MQFNSKLWGSDKFVVDSGNNGGGLSNFLFFFFLWDDIEVNK